MYEHVFNDQKQAAMRDYFLNDLSCHGAIRHYRKKQTIDGNGGLAKDHFGIVVHGKVSKSVISAQGCEKQLYTIRPGEIFGEMNLLCGGDLGFLIRAREDTDVSFVSRELLQIEISKNPSVYPYLINSITRKFRIILLQLTNSTFNDSTGRIADALIRLAACSDTLEADHVPQIISTSFTQNELACNVGCSRVTVTRVLKQFLDAKLISRRNKKIYIEDIDALASYTDRVQ